MKKPPSELRLDIGEAEAFYRDHAEEVIARMRHPTSQANNIAAVIVAQCATSPRLRAEAAAAIETARHAREARHTLNVSLAAYNQGSRIARSRVPSRSPSA